MNTFIAIVCFVLSLLGVDIGSHTFVDRIRADGADTLYSEVVARPDVTRFECVRSASGQCYYTVLPRECAPTSGSTGTLTTDCLAKPVERFVLPKGGSRQIPALPGFRLCVSAEAGSAVPDCDGAELMAAR